MKFIKKWIFSMRAPFLTASVVPVLFGTSLAWQKTGRFDLVLFLLTFFGVVSAHAGTNLSNDYYDHKTTDDDINETFTPFSGGSRMIQNGIQSPREVLTGAFVFFGIAAICGLCLWLVTKPVYGKPLFIPLLASIGFLSGYLYTATPIKIGYRGWGEIIVGVNFGVLAVMGSYFVQTGTIGWMPVITAIPISMLIAAVLYINQFPDYEADKQVDKRHWVVRLGKKRAVPIYLFLIFGSYAAILTIAIIGLLPLYTLVVFATFPLAIGAVRTLLVHYDKIEELLPANAATIKIHLSFGILMALGCLADKLI